MPPGTLSTGCLGAVTCLFTYFFGAKFDLERSTRGEPSSLPPFVILVGNSKKTQGIGVPESILRRVSEPIRQLGKSKGQAWDLHRSRSSRN